MCDGLVRPFPDDLFHAQWVSVGLDDFLRFVYELMEFKQKLDDDVFVEIGGFCQKVHINAVGLEDLIDWINEFLPVLMLSLLRMLWIESAWVGGCSYFIIEFILESLKANFINFYYLVEFNQG